MSRSRSLATVDLAPEIERMAGHRLRMRMVTIEPGGAFGPIHDHRGRPGTVYILEGTISDHRNGVATDYGPGLGWPEDRDTIHWLENGGVIPAVEISVDIVRQEWIQHRCRPCHDDPPDRGHASRASTYGKGRLDIGGHAREPRPVEIASTAHAWTPCPFIPVDVIEWSVS